MKKLLLALVFIFPLFLIIGHTPAQAQVKYKCKINSAAGGLCLPCYTDPSNPTVCSFSGGTEPCFPEIDMCAQDSNNCPGTGEASAEFTCGQAAPPDCSNFGGTCKTVSSMIGNRCGDATLIEEPQGYCVPGATAKICCKPATAGPPPCSNFSGTCKTVSSMIGNRCGDTTLVEETQGYCAPDATVKICCKPKPATSLSCNQNTGYDCILASGVTNPLDRCRITGSGTPTTPENRLGCTTSHYCCSKVNTELFPCLTPDASGNCAPLYSPCGTGSTCCLTAGGSGQTFAQLCSIHYRDSPVCTPPGGKPGTGIRTGLGCLDISGTKTIETILNWSVGIAGGIAFIMILIAAFQITTAAGDAKRVQAAQELLTSALAGLFLISLSVVLLNFIGVNVLGLQSLGFKNP